ncbi:MAG: c-type cytochrome [Rhodopila sp.]
MKHFVIAAVAATAVLGSPARAGGDSGAGKTLFRSICTLCHSTALGENKVGPSLFGIVGRHSGSVPGYSYSDANKNSRIIWTVDVLDKYLINPQAVVPGTKMGYPGQKDDQKRADIIAYLATLK